MQVTDTHINKTLNQYGFDVAAIFFNVSSGMAAQSLTSVLNI